MAHNTKYDVIIIGAGAAGLMAGYIAGTRGKRVLILEHTDKIGEKIRISGGGRCNFTNLYTSNNNFICQNPHFVKSALSKYTQHDFIELIKAHNISYHEKTLGQLFCDNSSKQIINMLLNLCYANNVVIKTLFSVKNIKKSENKFKVDGENEKLISNSLIIATGGLSIPKIGASDFGYRIATQFDLKIVPTKPALVPLIVSDETINLYSDLRGVSNYSNVTFNNTNFLENILFTHKGFSGPAILQISSYLDQFEDREILINLLPLINLKQIFIDEKNNKQSVVKYLKQHLTNRLADHLASQYPDFNQPIINLKKEKLLAIAELLHNYHVAITGSEGYLKAEVTAGGVDTDELSSKTMECLKVPGLFFIGEVVDVTGWLGGYNFQWAWSSGFAAGNSC